MDMSDAYLYTIGDNVTLTNCRIMNHDASMIISNGYTKIGRISIGNNVFVGAGTVISKDIPDNSVVVGNPCKIIETYDEFVEKNDRRIEISINNKDGNCIYIKK